MSTGLRPDRISLSNARGDTIPYQNPNYWTKSIYLNELDRFKKLSR
jgi:hypothetical protein